MNKLQIVLVVLGVTVLSVWPSCKKATDITIAALEITKPPVDLTVEVGDTDDANCLYVEAEGDEEELFYQWYIPKANGEGQIIEGATHANYIPDKSKIGVTKYFVAVWSANSNQIASNSVTVTVVEQGSLSSE